MDASDALELLDISFGSVQEVREYGKTEERRKKEGGKERF